MENNKQYNVKKRVILIFASLVFVLSTCREKDVPVGKLSIIPKPVNLEKLDGYFTINDQTVVIAEDNAAPAASYFVDLVNASSSFKLANPVKATSANSAIRFEFGGTLSDEGYELKVNQEGILIRASSAAGLMNGIQTLRQMLPPSFEEKLKAVSEWNVPAVKITDEPRFSWRGMHLDVSRHFFSVDFLKTFIDRLALYKINKLHLHLTDDQGWRIEIKKYPALTDRGAWRKLNNQDSACLRLAQKNPDFNLPQDFFRETGDGKVYGGFYSQEEIKDIVEYASRRAITIIPEIDMPGHMTAAIDQFPELTCVDGGGWGKLFSTPLCPCEESTYEFVENVVKEIAALFPAEYIHIGADEVDESTWRSSKQCSSFLREKQLKANELHSYFVNRVNEIVQRYGKKTIAWDEVMDGNPDSAVTVMYWRGWVPDAPVNAARTGHEVIMSPTSHFYFDYEPDNNTVRNLYQYEPIPAALVGKQKNNIIGLQANIWTEYIPTTARLDYMTMPRMTALAEVAWAKARDWSDFSTRQHDHFDKWDALKISYRLPDIENVPTHQVFTDTTSFRVTLPFGVKELRYTTDGSEPNENSTLYAGPLQLDSSVIFKTVTFARNGRRGNRKDVHFEKQALLDPANISNAKAGVHCEYFETKISSVKEMDALSNGKTFVLQKIEFPSTKRPEIFALKLEGLIYVPEDGIYTFYLSSDDGSSLTIGDRLVVNNDGPHADKEIGGEVALKKGFHTYMVKYFDSGGGNSLKMMYEGPATAKQEVPAAALRLK